MPFYNEISNMSNIVSSVDGDPDQLFGIYAEAYHNAAKILSDHYFQVGGFTNYNMFPIVFLYRHSFELHLKNIIYQSRFLCNYKNIDGVNLEYDNTHKLDKTAKTVISIFKKMFPNDCDEEFKNILNKIQKVADEFVMIDPESYAYRYPINKNGCHSTKMKQVVNMEDMYNTMEWVLRWLDTFDLAMSMETEQLQEMQKEIQKEIDEYDRNEY